MSEQEATATAAMYTPLIPTRPRLRFIEGAGDGAAGDAEQVDQVDDEVSDDEAETGSDEAALGDAGRQALARMKAERQAARAEARKAKAEADALRTELAMKDKPADEQALEAAKAEARLEATTAANKRILRSELKALATGKLADPSDAALYINLDDFTVDDDGEVDSDALSEAIAELLEKKPHLAAQKPNRFTGDGDQGAKGKDSKPAQMTRDDLRNLTPEQIVAAKSEGRLNELLGIPS